MSLSWVGASASSSAGSTSVAPTYPASGSWTPAAGDLAVMCIVSKIPPNAPSTPSGWNPLLQVQGGHGTDGVADQGQVYLTLFSRVCDGGETPGGSVSVTITGGNSACATIGVVRSSTAATISIASATGSDNSGGSTAMQATMDSDPGLTVGDAFLVAAGINGDLALAGVATNTSIPGCTHSGLDSSTTFSTGATNTGADCNHKMRFGTIATGTSSGAATVEFTCNSSSTYCPAGGLALVRLRESSAATGQPARRRQPQRPTPGTQTW